MTEHLLHARLLNEGGELIAEGPCWLDESAGRATLEPERELGVIQRERGRLALELDSGRSLLISEPPMVFRLGSPTSTNSKNGHRSLYRLRVANAQEANAAGAAGEGAPALHLGGGLRGNEETQAAR